MPEYANRSKRDKTLYEDKEYLTKSKLTIDQIEGKYSFTKKEDLDWILDWTSSKDEFENAYRDFIKKHFNNMKKILLDNYEQI